jgi:ABC-type lipoprotein release transport system permease subunit
MMSAVLYRVSPYDARSYLAVVVTFILVAALSSWFPARRAAALPPSALLRDE